MPEKNEEEDVGEEEEEGGMREFREEELRIAVLEIPKPILDEEARGDKREKCRRP